VLVFTGALEITRSEAAQLAATVGCTVAEGVTKETACWSRKELQAEKAGELIQKGQATKILTQSDFENLVRLATAA
jgi:DNA polymerase III subunit epsilon